ncbi:MAG: MFS transporter [Egibacteraceae bacterium]
MTTMTAAAPTELDVRGNAGIATFRRLLVNTLVSGVTSSFLWFALTFWVYLETRSVVATAVIGAAFSLSSAVFGPAYGTYVDGHRKKHAMALSTSVSAVCFALATVMFLVADTGSLLDLANPLFWALVAVTLLGSVAGQMRGIALSTCVTLLVPEERRDRANGMIGTVTGISFAVTSVFSGLVIGHLGMGWALYGALALTVVALVHLAGIDIPETVPAADGSEPARRVDVRGAVEAIRAVPGLWMLIGLAAFNNLLAGVFMSLVDAYGLSLVSVQVWGLLFGFISLAFIAGGLVVAKVGLGSKPLRVILVGNLVNWTTCALFPVWDSVVPLVLAMTVWLALIPAIEAAETVLQRAIPYERQGRVFGFAQLVENAASPITALAMGPLAEIVFMPSATDGWIADTIGTWWGIGPERGLGVMFTLAGLLGIAVTALALASRSYQRLSTETTTAADRQPGAVPATLAAQAA